MQSTRLILVNRNFAEVVYNRSPMRFHAFADWLSPWEWFVPIVEGFLNTRALAFSR
jgi:hypothetical protein